ncbi:hypothetical protein BHM03_00034261, partial [Ensete ventricosum]
AAVALSHRQSPCHGAATPVPALPPLLAVGLVVGSSPLRASCSRDPLASAVLQAAVPAAGASTHKHHPCELLPLRVGATPCGHRWPPLRAGLGCSRSPSYRETWSWPGRVRPALHGGWPWLVAPPCCLHYDNTTRTHYAIQSRHTQFKINLSYENLSSDSTVGKPQWVHRIHSENQNKNWFPMQIKPRCMRD